MEHICEYRKGAEVLYDPFLQKHACSQLALLSEEAYQEGLDKIKADLLLAGENGEGITFISEIAIMMLTGCRSK